MIADISHDIKTPVTVICGGIDAICDGKVPPSDLDRTLRMIRRRADTLAQLTDDFHEYAKVEHPAFVLHTERADLCEFLREYLAAKYDEIELAGFSLETQIPEHPVWCRIDCHQLTRALDNLLSNALRHNRLGTALFFAVTREDRRAVVWIADNGEGIPPERRARISSLSSPAMMPAPLRAAGSGFRSRAGSSKPTAAPLGSMRTPSPPR